MKETRGLYQLNCLSCNCVSLCHFGVLIHQRLDLEARGSVRSTEPRFDSHIVKTIFIPTLTSIPGLDTKISSLLSIIDL